MNSATSMVTPVARAATVPTTQKMARVGAVRPKSRADAEKQITQRATADGGDRGDESELEDVHVFFSCFERAAGGEYRYAQQIEGGECDLQELRFSARSRNLPVSPLLQPYCRRTHLPGLVAFPAPAASRLRSKDGQTGAVSKVSSNSRLFGGGVHVHRCTQRNQGSRVSCRSHS